MYCRMYNMLPQCLVELESVKNFQSKLTHLAKTRAEHGMDNWRQAYQSCLEIHNMFRGRFAINIDA